MSETDSKSTENDRIFNAHLQGIRTQAKEILHHSLSGQGLIAVRMDRIELAADDIVHGSREGFEDLETPLYSMWNDLEWEGRDRLLEFEDKLESMTPLDRARAKTDFIVVAHVLSRGTPIEWTTEMGGWQFHESEASPSIFGDSALTVAIYRMFSQGGFSSHPDDPFRVDAGRLLEMTISDLRSGLQSTHSENELPSLIERCARLKILGKTLSQKNEIFGGVSPRPGNLMDWLWTQTTEDRVSVHSIFYAAEWGLRDLWSHGSTRSGDAWTHQGTQIEVPFHRNALALTFALVESAMDAGMDITSIEDLCIPADEEFCHYLFRQGAIEPRDPKAIQQSFSIESDFVIEWRALTSAVGELVWERVRNRLKANEATFPLAKFIRAGLQPAALKRKELHSDSLPTVTASGA